MSRKSDAAKALAAKEADEAQEREAAKAALERRKSQRTTSELRSLVRHLEKQHAEDQARLELLLGIDAKTLVAQHRALKPPKRRKGNPPTVSFSLASDLHVEEEVDPQKVGWRNEFSIDIADERLDRFWRNVVRLQKMAGAEADIRQHVAWMGGDFFSGHIHEDLIESTALTPLQAIQWLLPRFVDGLRRWRKEMDVELLTVLFNYGNHGHLQSIMGKTRRVQTAAEHNLDWHLGCLVAKALEEDDGIEVKVAAGQMLYLDLPLVDGRTFTVCTQHMDGMRYGGGVGGITIPLNKAIAQWDKFRPADLYVGGHWHQRLDTGRAVLNGSLIGYSPFSLWIKGEYEPPQQTFFLVDLERGEKTGVFPVHVTDPPKSQR